MPPDAKSPQSGMSPPQDDENLPKVKSKALNRENIGVIVEKAFIPARSNISSLRATTLFLLLPLVPLCVCI